MCHSRAAAPENPSWLRTFRYACTLVMLSCSRLSRKLVRSSIMYRRPQSPLLPPLPAPAGAALDPAAAAAVSLPLPPFCCAMREESLESSAAASSACFAAWSRRRAAASSHCSRMSRMGMVDWIPLLNQDIEEVGVQSGLPPQLPPSPPALAFPLMLTSSSCRAVRYSVTSDISMTSG